jgi:hypothetical protein
MGALVPIPKGLSHSAQGWCPRLPWDGSPLTFTLKGFYQLNSDRKRDATAMRKRHLSPAGLLSIPNRRHKNHSQNHKYHRALQQHRQQRQNHPTNPAANRLAATPHHPLANQQSRHRNENQQRHSKCLRHVYLGLAGKQQQQKINSRADEC